MTKINLINLLLILLLQSFQLIASHKSEGQLNRESCTYTRLSDGAIIPLKKEKLNRILPFDMSVLFLSVCQDSSWEQQRPCNSNSSSCLTEGGKVWNAGKFDSSNWFDSDLKRSLFGVFQEGDHCEHNNNFKTSLELQCSSNQEKWSATKKNPCHIQVKIKSPSFCFPESHKSHKTSRFSVGEEEYQLVAFFFYAVLALFVFFCACISFLFRNKSTKISEDLEKGYNLVKSVSSKSFITAAPSLTSTTLINPPIPKFQVYVPRHGINPSSVAIHIYEQAKNAKVAAAPTRPSTPPRPSLYFPSRPTPPIILA
eukprot:TRINITY_DN4193_c0_g1_i4.p1 TRINITY_DN4193_c0_g1~~TRINITY_DN4193_c0_g1_i4.p1  ORF type:complete len:312 (-),score=48.55 TRINITY_DN4193_c0_g1_i4:450-1385(-)